MYVMARIMATRHRLRVFSAHVMGNQTILTKAHLLPVTLLFPAPPGAGALRATVSLDSPDSAATAGARRPLWQAEAPTSEDAALVPLAARHPADAAPTPVWTQMVVTR